MSSRADDKRAPEERGYAHRRSALDLNVEYVDLAEHVGLGVTIAHEHSKPRRKRDRAPRPPPAPKGQRRKVR